MSRMTLSDRIEIEAGIYARKSLSEIAERIHKSRRHVSEELRRNATLQHGSESTHFEYLTVFYDQIIGVTLLS